MILTVEAPDVGLTDFESLAVTAAIVLSLAAIIIGLVISAQQAQIKDKLDEIDDRTTLPFAETHVELAEEEDEPDTDQFPAVPPTEPNGMPLAVESDKLAAEREPEIEKLYRTFTTGDGKVHRFEIKRQA